MYKYLNNIDSPEDLKKLKTNQLIDVSKDLRQFLIDSVSVNPGHFGAGLGVVELTIALHYALNTPNDRIIWDVGHQAYGHKILTGRKNVFHTNRKYGGISGFPKPEESEYDAFAVGHASTSISAALGMAVSAKQKNENRQIVAVIGDGSLTGGMAFEGLNNAGIQNSDILVILNDNNMAIDPNVGALKDYLIDVATSKTYNRIKNNVWDFLGKINKLGPNTQKVAQKIDNALKSLILKQSNLFESLNFRYFGPVDGHDVVQLANTLKRLKTIPGPKLLHIRTIKGKGFESAEKNQTQFHAPGLFDKNTGKILHNSNKEKPPKFQDVFGETIIELADNDKRIYGITPAMPTGSSLNLMMKKYPERAIDVGIAEQHAVTFSAGLAKEGMIPFCNIYSTFIQRAYDQIIHDVALQKLPVIFCLDRGGLVGEDGETHHGIFDITYMRSIPNMIVSAPMTVRDLRNLMYTAQLQNKLPFSIRYPRGRGLLNEWKLPFEEIKIGKALKISDGDDLVVLSFGFVGNDVQSAIIEASNYGFKISHYDMRFVKPIDEEILKQVFEKYSTIITVEDGALQGGFGSAIAEFMIDNNYNSKIIRLGVPDKFISHGTQQELRKECGFDKENILKTILSNIKKTVSSYK